jgi:hypothetical protein
MTKKRRFKTAEEEIEAIRQEPEFKALVEDLKSQTPEQLDRMDEYLQERTGEEATNGRDDKEDS